MEDKDLKYDDGKPRVDLIEPDFILGVARILTYGAKKYTPNSWKTSVKDPMNRYYAAAMRHLLAWKCGDKTDNETGENHLYHAACNLMFMAYFDMQIQAERD